MKLLIIFRAAPNRARWGIARKIIEAIHSGRLKTSRTSSGKAAKNICEKLL
jgi:hypothetical protein